LNDLEVTVKIWDISTGQKHMLSSFEVYLERRNETSLISNVVLERRYVGVNRRIMMTVEHHGGRVLAKGIFDILGEGERYSGEVSFTDEETQGDIEYGDAAEGKDKGDDDDDE
jgi:hypothetical protein